MHLYPLYGHTFHLYQRCTGTYIGVRSFDNFSLLLGNLQMYAFVVIFSRHHEN